MFPELIKEKIFGYLFFEIKSIDDLFHYIEKNPKMLIYHDILKEKNDENNLYHFPHQRIIKMSCTSTPKGKCIWMYYHNGLLSKSEMIISNIFDNHCIFLVYNTKTGKRIKTYAAYVCKIKVNQGLLNKMLHRFKVVKDNQFDINLIEGLYEYL